MSTKLDHTKYLYDIVSVATLRELRLVINKDLSAGFIVELLGGISVVKVGPYQYLFNQAVLKKKSARTRNKRN